MRRAAWPLLLLVVLAGVLTVRTPLAPAVGGDPATSEATFDVPVPAAAAPAQAQPRLDVAAAFQQVDGRGDDIERLEEELHARVIESEEAREEIFAAFLRETEPERLSFLQNVLASHPPVRNDAAWQERFVGVAEKDELFARRRAALLFLQQAETVRAVHERMFALAERGELRAPALIALKGLPDRRLADPRLMELVARMADCDSDARLRALALRIEDSPEHARRYVEDPDPVIREAACRVVEAEATR